MTIYATEIQTRFRLNPSYHRESMEVVLRNKILEIPSSMAYIGISMILFLAQKCS